MFNYFNNEIERVYDKALHVVRINDIEQFSGALNYIQAFKKIFTDKLNKKIGLFNKNEIYSDLIGINEMHNTLCEKLRDNYITLTNNF